MYINTTTLQQFSEQDIRTQYPNTSFPYPFVPPEDFAYIFSVPKPEQTSTTIVQAAQPELTEKGHWEERWTVVNRYATQEEADVAIAAEAEAKRVAAIPASVSPRQIRQALTATGMRTQIEDAINAADLNTQDWYHYATEFRRDSTVVKALAEALSITDRQLDDLWTLAGTL